MFLLYTEINIACIICVLFIIYKVFSGRDMQYDLFLFVRLLVVIVIFFVMDTVWIIQGVVKHPLPPEGCFVVICVNFIAAAVGSYYWYVYSEHMQGNKIPRLSVLPVVFLVVMDICSYWTKWIFSVDAANDYHRGQLFFIQALICCGYIMVTSCKALIKALDKRCYVEHSQYVTFASFIIFPILIVLPQIVLINTPTMNLGIAMLVIYVYVNFQEKQITVDSLTQLNNHNQLMKYLSYKVNHLSEDKDLFLLIIDVDNFHKINDRYGRIEGDKVLIQVAKALKYVCIGQSYFSARFGGDKFVILNECQSSEEITKLYYRIQSSITFSNVNSAKPYGISLSVGAAKYDPQNMTIQDFIDCSMEELRKMKQERKKQRETTETEKNASSK